MHQNKSKRRKSPRKPYPGKYPTIKFYGAGGPEGMPSGLLTE